MTIVLVLNWCGFFSAWKIFRRKRRGGPSNLFLIYPKKLGMDLNSVPDNFTFSSYSKTSVLLNFWKCWILSTQPLFMRDWRRPFLAFINPGRIVKMQLLLSRCVKANTPIFHRGWMAAGRGMRCGFLIGRTKEILQLHHLIFMKLWKVLWISVSSSEASA